MSSVVRPSGPLPSGVYWVRRLVLVLVLVAVVALVWWYVPRPGSDDGGSPSSAGSARSQSQDTEPTQTVSASPDTPPESDRKGRSQPARDVPERPKPDKKRLAQPTGECEPAEVGIEVVVDNAEAGEGTSARLRLISEVEPACTLAITPDSLALRVTSGSDTVWTSQECPDSVLSRQLVVREGRSTAYTFDWDGKRSVVSCQGPGEVAAAGGYWFEAALVGADVEKAYFEVA